MSVQSWGWGRAGGRASVAAYVLKESQSEKPETAFPEPYKSVVHRNLYT